MLAVNKADLLPAQATARRLEVCPYHNVVIPDPLHLPSPDRAFSGFFQKAQPISAGWTQS